jgi:uncharacterized protein YjbJ (UPF0337 family)
MHKLMAWLKNIRLERVLTAFLVGLLLFVSSACSNKVQAKTADQIREEVPSNAVTNQYKGGMNNYSDVDPRKNTTEANTKAKALVDNAKKNINEKSVDSLEQYGQNYRSGTPIGERVKRIGEDVSNSVENLKENVSKGTQKNLRQTQGLVDDVKTQAIQTKENAKDATKDAAKSVKRAVSDVSQAGESKINQGVKSTQRALEDTADASDNLGKKIKGGAQDVADTVKSGVNKVTNAID